MNGLGPPLETHYQLVHDSPHAPSHFEELDKRYALLPSHEMSRLVGSHVASGMGHSRNPLG